MKETIVTLGGPAATTVVHAVQGEAKAQRLVMHLHDLHGREVEIPTDATVTLHIESPEAPVLVECSLTSDNAAAAVLPYQACDKAGLHPCTLQVVSQDMDLRSESFMLRVEPNNLDDVASLPEFGPLATLLQSKGEIAELLKQAQEAGADLDEVLDKYLGDFRPLWQGTYADSQEYTAAITPDGTLLLIDAWSWNGTGSYFSTDGGKTWKKTQFSTDDDHAFMAKGLAVGPRILVIDDDRLVWGGISSVTGEPYWDTPVSITFPGLRTSPPFMQTKYLNGNYFALIHPGGDYESTPTGNNIYYFTEGGTSPIHVSLPNTRMVATSIAYDEIHGRYVAAGRYAFALTEDEYNYKAWAAVSTDLQAWTQVYDDYDAAYYFPDIAVFQGKVFLFPYSSKYKYQANFYYTESADILKGQWTMTRLDYPESSSGFQSCNAAVNLTGMFVYGNGDRMFYTKDGAAFVKYEIPLFTDNDKYGNIAGLGRYLLAASSSDYVLYRTDLIGENLIDNLNSLQQSYQEAIGNVTSKLQTVDATNTRIAAAETARVDAENARAGAEQARQTVEAARQTAEQERVSGEAARNTAETARAAAESARNFWDDYDAVAAYVPGNKVAFEGSSYLNLAACTGISPTDKSKWRLIAAKGDTGPQGIQGPKGETGAVGPQGAKGDTGAQGLKGDTGAMGPTGPQGLKGDKGDTGPAGPQGERGLQGLTGEQGPKGDKGDTGPAGPQGLKGDTGPQGPIGPQGPQGEKGDTGLQGEQGIQGPKGDTGAKGEQGLTGPVGPQGEQGPQGLTGPQGPKGEKGDTGAAGPKGDTGPVGPQGPKGDTGPQGPQGVKGETGTGLTILGQYATVEALQAAVASPTAGMAYNVGSAPPYRIYIWSGTEWMDNGPLQGAPGETGAQGPKGDPFTYADFTPEQLEGLRGPQGPKGDTGAKGDKGETGAQGPKGETGERGPQGEPGIQGAAGPTGPQGPKGETGDDGASAYELAVAAGFTGTQAQWLGSLKGDKGETGLQGPKGDTGAKGDTGPQGAKGDTGAQGIQGPKGETGPAGAQGPKGDKGDPGIQGPKGDRGEAGQWAGDAPEAGLLTVETELYARQDGAVKRTPALALLQAVSDPDNHPLGGNPESASSPALEAGGINRDTGEPEASSSKVRTADFIPVNPGRKVSVDNGQKLTNVLFCYDSGKTPILDWYLSDGKSYSYKNVSDGGSVVVPSHCAYVKVTLSTTDTTVPLGITSEASPAQFAFQKLYLPEGYGLRVEESESKISELQVFSGQGQKLTVLPDASPVKMTAGGLEVSRNPDGTDPVTVNLAELKELADAHTAGLEGKPDLIQGKVPVNQLPDALVYAEGDALPIEDAALNADRLGGHPAEEYPRSATVKAIWSGSQAQYDAIAVKDPETLYLIVG